VLSSGTAALHALYAAMGIGRGDVVVTSPLTFAATANAAVYLGARVEFADIDPSTGLIDPAAADALMSTSVRLIVGVDYAGLPADYDALQPLADKAGATLLADAAHSLGARDHGREVGTLAHGTVLSFHPVKIITSGEGGAVLTSDGSLRESVARFRSHGIQRDPDQMRRSDGAWYHEMVSLGYNYRMTDIQAALGGSQLRKLDHFLRRRRDIAGRYDVELSDVPGLDLPGRREGTEPAWHLYVVRVVEKDRRRAFFDALRRQGLGVQVHYLPVYRHPFYEDLGYRSGLCPVAEDFYARAVSLPIFPAMTESDVDRVVDTVHRTAAEILA
jgi:dTDP-4-amino-4,6-dideoxygalactose transaminase